MTITLSWDRAVAATVGAAALLAAILYLFNLARKATRFVRRYLTRIRDLLEGELEHNHGSSMKDDVHGIAVSVGKLQRDVDDMRAEFDAHLGRTTRQERNPHE